MHSTFSPVGFALVLSSLCSTAFAFPRLWGSDQRSTAAKRDLCIFDDYLQSLNNFRPDTEPFCSSYISIPLITATARTATAISTTSTTATSVISGVTVTTVISATETLTTTVGLGERLKRAPGPTPAAARAAASVWFSKIQRDAVADTSIGLALSSACSCLHVEPSTTTVTPTTSTTRTISAIDYQFATAAITNTTTTTATVTRLPFYTIPSASPIPYSNSSFIPPAPTTDISASTPSLSPLPSSNYTLTISSTTTTTASASPTVTPFDPDGCPAINGTIITAASNGETFLVLCEVDFPGADVIGLREPNLEACVDECAQVNDGFSATRCLGASFRPQLERNCYLKTNVDQGVLDPPYEVVSAILISALNSTDTTNTTTTTSSTPAPFPAFNTTIAPVGPTATGSTSLNITSLIESLVSNTTTTFPTLTLDSSATPTSYVGTAASTTPSVSMNMTTVPSLSINGSRTEWSSTSSCSACSTITTKTEVVFSTSVVYVTTMVPGEM
ncbi:hypothetical protein MMC16_003585 [Acarospora aff. strigata]|nr:hypothetical protein [Acarospora aff. strigata]